MGQSLDLLLAEAVRDGAIGDAEVSGLRRALYGEGGQVGEAFRLLWEADKRRTAHSAEWSRLFVEAALDVAIRETPPRGYFPAQKAQTVMEALGEKGEVRVDTVLEALVSIVEKAAQAPTDFAAFVLRRLKTAVIFSDDVTASGERLTPGLIGLPELSLIRRVIWGAGEEGHLAVSRAEAEALFDIADATAGARNAPEWDEFFAGAVGNYLIGATGRPAPSRAVAFERWEAPAKRDALGFFSSIFTRAGEMDLDDVRGDLDRHRLGAMIEASWGRENAARAQQRACAEQLVGAKADWIVDRIKRNGALTGPESALVAFLAREARQLPPELRALAQARRAG